MNSPQEKLDQSAQAASPRFTQFPFAYAKRHGAFLEWQAEGAVLCYKDGIAPEVFGETQRVIGGDFGVQKLDDNVFQQRLTAAFQAGSQEAMQMVQSLGDDMDLTDLANAVPESEDVLEQGGDAPIIRLINALIAEAIKIKASDIHIETFEKHMLVRFRVDGVLREMARPRRQLAPMLVSRIKVMAQLDIAEKRVPQDGRISLLIGGRNVDIRVSTMPSSNGERVVLRLLDQQAAHLNLTSLGMPDDLLAQMQKLLRRPHGIFLVTGPTGSGKTTTLYAGLTDINDTSRNILTVEDPIEYNIEGIGQTQVNTKADMTFARGLRAILRQDPDVVMVGEIRDRETADIAVQASLTGHMVLSTLHTNTAVGAITRLRDMGVEPFLLSSSLTGVLAQRLVRTLCKHCRESHTADEAELGVLGLPAKGTATIYTADGCSHCGKTGYTGRTGIYELIVIDDEIKNLVHSNASEEDIVRLARRHQHSIRADGRARVLDGTTSIEELLRVTQEGA